MSEALAPVSESRTRTPPPPPPTRRSSDPPVPRQWTALRLDGDTPRARATAAYVSVVADRTVTQHLHCIDCERRTTRRVLPVPLALERRMNVETGERCWGVFELYCCSPNCSLRFLARCDETLLPDGRVASLAYQREMLAAVYGTPTAEFGDGGGGADDIGVTLDPLFYEHVDGGGGGGGARSDERHAIETKSGDADGAGDRRREPCRLQRLSQRQNARLYRAEVLVVEHRYAYLEEKDDGYLYGLKRAERFGGDPSVPRPPPPPARGAEDASASANAPSDVVAAPRSAATAALAPIAFKIGGTKRKRVRTMLTEDELKLDALVEDVIVGENSEQDAVSRGATSSASEREGARSGGDDDDDDKTGRESDKKKARVAEPEPTVEDAKKKKGDIVPGSDGGGGETLRDAHRFETLVPAERLSILRIFDGDDGVVGKGTGSSSSSSSDDNNPDDPDDNDERRAAEWRACKWRARVRDYGRRQSFTCRHCRRRVADGWPIAVVAERDIVTTQYGGETACCSPGCLVAFLTYAPEDALGRPRARLLKWATEMLFYAYGVVNAVPNPPRWLAAEFCRNGYEPDEFWRLGELGIHAATVGPGEQHDSFAPAASWRDMAAFSGADGGLRGASASRRNARVVGVLARKNYYRSDAVKQLLLESRQRRDAAAARASKNGGGGGGGGGDRPEDGATGGGGGGGGDDRSAGAESVLLGDSALPRPHVSVFAKLSGVAKLSARVLASHGGARPRSTIGSIYPPLT